MMEAQDGPQIPVSSGIPPVVIWSVAIGVAIIFVILGMVVFGSPYHHIWPASDTTRVKLT